MPPVPIPRRQERPPATPEALYERLSVTDPAIGALWRHQAHMLQRYYEHRSTADVALELPTGAGKTLVGLLIADWRRQTEQRSSAFLCPTRQLAQQAYDKAGGYGIPAVLLTGTHTGWEPAERTRGLNGEATIISVYSHIFNSSPKIAPGTLVLDDAHAAEGFVAKSWSLAIPRRHAAYAPLLDALSDQLDAGVRANLVNDEADTRARPAPAFVGPATLGARAEQILAVLDAHIGRDDPLGHSLRRIRTHLGACALYASWSELLLRPFVPPTRFHPAFADARQRIYLSATLGSAGELERAFGRVDVERVAMPPGWERHGSGRRLVLMPAAGMPGPAAAGFMRRTIGALPRSLALVPSRRRIEEVQSLLPEDWQRFTMEDVDDRLEPFRSCSRCTLILTNRYDGIDLPGETCRLIVITGLPAGTHLQERFLFDTADARSALRERIRTRLVQGMGRATRSRSDRAIVLLTAEDLLTFVNDPGNLTGMRPELQAEIAYGQYLARERASLDDAVTAFLAGGSEWEDAEAYLRDQAEEAELDPPAGAQALEQSARSEVLACEAAWRGEMGIASTHAQAAARQLTAQAVGGYRTVWKVLAAHWAVQHALVTQDPLDARVAAELSRDARASARSRPWHPSIPSVEVRADAETLARRAVRIAERLMRLARTPRADRYLERAEQSIGETDSTQFELGLLWLGELLGFDAVRPAAKASPDGAWRDGDDHLLWEAKSEQLAGGVVSVTNVRQANTHPTWVERQLDWSEESVARTFLVTPRTEIDTGVAAIAAEHVVLCSPDAVRALAADAVAMWQDLLGQVNGLSAVEVAERVERQLLERGLETAQLPTRLGARPLVDLRDSSEAGV